VNRSESTFDKQYYDEIYRTDDRTYQRPRTSPYYPMYRMAAEFVRETGCRHVLEVGCGSGVLAEMLIQGGADYKGFDISSVGIERAKIRNPSGAFALGDATAVESYNVAYDVIVCCEVLEHIEQDLKVVSLWRAGVACVCSVPNFLNESHVRHFKSEAEVTERYGKYIDIKRTVRIPKRAGANLTWGEYFRRLRWSRDDPKRVLGILGLNAFNWYGGWFVFLGNRR